MAERVRVDARGAYCPGPLMELIAALRLVPVGEEVEVWSSDKGSAADIPEWIKKARHELVGVEPREAYWSIVVRKAR
ncbi:MAG TPA: sulfurtransferase TusA family protein [Stellaceae bacterium]|nr:sulfurtransferase TusA family protein [Stellaceae bacterium]